MLQEFGGELQSTRLQKFLFLLTQRQSKKAYGFVPYKFGCFSFESYADLHFLLRSDELEQRKEGLDGKWRLKREVDYKASLLPEDRLLLVYIHRTFGSLSMRDLIRHVYLKYPYYATRSEIADKYLDTDELKNIEELKAAENGADVLYTIGYEGTDIDVFVDKLIKNNVCKLFDVRRNAFSMKVNFNKQRLSSTLEKVGIDYEHVPELGIASDYRRELGSDESYAALFRLYAEEMLPPARRYFERIHEQQMQLGAVAITCFEADAARCHRGVLARAASEDKDWQAQIVHL